MLTKTAVRFAGPLGVVAVCGAILLSEGDLVANVARSEPAQAQQAPQPVAKSPASFPAPEKIAAPMSEAEKAIRAFDDAFVRAYNSGDSQAVAALFSEDAEAIEPGGARLEGREAIERLFAETFAASPGVKITIEADSVRFLGSDVAREEGRTLIDPPKAARVVRPYTALLVKRDGQWRLSSVHEEADPIVRPHERLRDLEWLVGDWVDESPESQVKVHCAWSEDGNFLMRSFTVKRAGRPVMSVTQRIGWDPVMKRIRSWEFDSEGGFGEGTWSRDGDRWVVKHSGVRPEGIAASSTNIMIKERSDLVRWSANDRVLGDEALPGSESFVMVRVPPPPRAPAGTPGSAR